MHVTAQPKRLQAFAHLSMMANIFLGVIRENASCREEFHLPLTSSSMRAKFASKRGSSFPLIILSTKRMAMASGRFGSNAECFDQQNRIPMNAECCLGHNIERHATQGKPDTITNAPMGSQLCNKRCACVIPRGCRMLHPTYHQGS